MPERPSRLSSGLKDALTLAALTAVWAVFYWQLLTPVGADRLQFRSGDFDLQFLAMRQRAFAQVAEGRYPVYEPCIYSGYPAQADPQNQLSYPPLLAVFALGRALGWPEYPLRALEWEVLGHAWLAAAGMLCLLRGLGLRRRSALFGAVVFGLGGFMTGYALLQIAILFTAAWMPWMLLAFWWLATRTRTMAGPVALAAFAASMTLLGGNAQLFVYAMYVSAAAFVMWGRAAGLTWRAMIVRGAFAGAAGVCLSAPALIPEALFAASSTRALASYSFLSGGFELNDFVSIVLPRVTAVWWPLHVGALAAVMAVAALKWRWREIRVWLLIAAGALVLSFGAHAAGFELAYLIAPGYGQFRQQERHASVFSLTFSIIAAYGVDALLAELSLRGRVWLRRGSVLIGLLALIGLTASVLAGVLVRMAAPNPAAGPVLDALALVTLMLAAAAALWRWRGSSGAAPAAFFIVVLGVLVFELGTANRANPEAFQKQRPDFGVLPILQPALSQDAPYAGSAVRVNNHFGLPLNGACMNGLSEIGGGSPIVDRRYAEFLKRTPEEVSSPLLNVRYTVTWRGGMGTDSGARIPARQLKAGQFDGKEIWIYALDWEPRTDQRAWVAPRVTRVSGEEAIYERLSAPGFSPFGEAFVTDVVAGIGTSSPVRGSARVEGTAVGYYKVQASADAPALLVVSESHLRNWRAIVNGVPGTLVRVDGALIGVPIPAGESSIELSYRPDDLYAGLALCAIAVLGLLGWAWVDRARAGREPT